MQPTLPRPCRFGFRPDAARVGVGGTHMRARKGLGQILDATRFLSRLPVRPLGGEPDGELAVALRAAPWAGVLIGAGPALVLVLGSRFGLPSLAAVTLAVTALIAATGGLHEDGLADVADGFGGGATVSRKLAIMRDSRIGTFGALALGAGFLLRVAALQGLAERNGAGAAALALLAAAALSRGLMLLPLALLPPARPDGLARLASPDGQPAFGPALAAAGLLALALAWPMGPDKVRIASGLVAALAAAFAMTRAAQRHVRGVTGDVVGATQQVTEIAFLLTLCSGGGMR